MGTIIFVIMAGLEIALAVRTCRAGGSVQVWKRDRMAVRMIQAVVILIALIIPAGQKWRWAPVLGWIILLLIIAVISWLKVRSKEGSASGKTRKASGIIVTCILCLLMTGFSMVPAFVFTGYSGLPVTGKYKVNEASAILIDESRTDPFEQDGSCREVPVHFYYPENAEERSPLVIFSHGAFGYYQSNTSTYMELASNGYVVVSLDHPHQAFFTEDTDGKMVIVDRGFLNTAMSLNDDSGITSDTEKNFETYKSWMELRTADMDLAVDKLKSAAEAGILDNSWFTSGDSTETILSILEKTDTDKIGLMGHSMGGATSVALGRERDDIDAVIDIDGTMLSEYTGVKDGKYTVNEEPYEVPVLEFVNWESYNDNAEFFEQYRAEGILYPNFELMRNAPDGCTTTIRDTKHMDFTDLPLLSPALGRMLGSGERDTAETMNIVNSTVLQFYDHYLKDEGGFEVKDIL